MISQNYIAQLKAVCDIQSVMESYVDLKRAGRYLKCNCPFHLENTPSCVVYQDTQSFYCFGCGAGGDVITFIMKIENLDYMEAVRFLAQKAGMQPPEDEKNEYRIQKRARLYEMNKWAARFYHQQLTSPSGKEGLAYFAQRALNKKTVITYGLGYAPDSWTALKEELISRGFTEQEALSADLITRAKNGNLIDKFRNRVIFPILDLQGHVIAFGARILGEGRPKYLNTSDTPIFKKSRHLFSLNFAKNSGEKRLILCEGYMDVIAMYQAGFHNAVATLGTALTEEQARLLSRYCTEVVIAYDSDEAGILAMERASGIFESAGVKAHVLQLKGAKDPDEYIKKFGPGKFRLLLENADSVFLTKQRQIKEKYHLEDPDEKIEFIRESCEMIAGMKDPVQTDVYIGNLAEETGISREILKSQVQTMQKKAHRKQLKEEWNHLQRAPFSKRDKINPESTQYPRAAYAEQGILFFLFHNPDYLESLKKQIQPDDFATSFHKKVYSCICKRIEGEQPLDMGMFQEDFTPEEIGRISGILNDAQRHSNKREYMQDCVDCLLRQKDQLDDTARQNLTLEEIESRRLKLREEKR